MVILYSILKFLKKIRRKYFNIFVFKENLIDLDFYWHEVKDLFSSI